MKEQQGFVCIFIPWYLLELCNDPFCFPSTVLRTASEKQRIFPRVSPFQIPLSFSLAEQQGFVCIFFPMGRKLWCCPPRAGDKQHPTGVLHLNVQISLPLPSKKFHPSWGGTFLAEQQGFEPWRQLPSLRDFESRLFDHLSTAPYAPSYYINRKRKNQGFSGGFFAISRTNAILSLIFS